MGYKIILSKINRADIVDIDGNYLAKTVSETDIGIDPKQIINNLHVR